MFTQTVTLPPPFYQIRLLGLIEPVEEKPGEITFFHRLYLVNSLAEGGKTLVWQVRGGTLCTADLSTVKED